MARRKYDEETVLKMIADGASADGIITEKLPGAEARFRRIDRLLLDYLAYVQRTFPDAQYYTGSGGFNLMLGNPHSEGFRQKSQQELIAFGGLAQIGDGDF